MGFIFISLGVLIAVIPGNNVVGNVALLSIIGGIITEFIAAIIVIIYRLSTQQTNEYFQSVKNFLEHQYAFDILERIEKTTLDDIEPVLNARMEVIRLILGSTPDAAEKGSKQDKLPKN